MHAQRLHELTPLSFYQKWSLVEIEPENNLLVYSPKAKSSSKVSIRSNAVLKFNRRNHIFYSKRINLIKQRGSAPKKKFDPNWSNVPKEKPARNIQRCGNGIIHNRPRPISLVVSAQYKKAGIWKVYIEDEDRFLVLEHIVLRNGKSVTLEKEEFEIVSLEEDKMVLRKVFEHAE